MHFGIRKKIKRLQRAIIISYLRMFGALYPLKEKQFFCISMQGNSYGCNIKPLSDYIEKMNAGNSTVWAFNPFVYRKFSDMRKGKSVCTGTFTYYKEQYTSKYIISNQRLTAELYPFKRKGQIYMQTWHGTALKRIEADIPYKNDIYQKRVQPDSKKIDVFISGSKFMTEIYKKSFWYSGDVYETGTPRNDIFYRKDSSIVDRVKKLLNIQKDEKLILYAPTFRNKSDSFAYYDIDSCLLQKVISREFGGVWRFLVKLHPGILNKGNSDRIKQMYPNAIDASSYPDMQELLYASDILITDYSSSMFDFMYTMRPCFLYVKDKDIYDRGFYLNMDELPFPKIESNETLEQVIISYKSHEYEERVKKFMDRIGSVEDGHATEKCYRLLIDRD